MIDSISSSSPASSDPCPGIHEELVDRFRKDCELRKFTTSNSYSLSARRFCIWLETRNVSASEVTKKDLKDYIYHLQKNRRLKFGSIRHDFIAINCFYSFLEEEELISSNPVPAYMKRYLGIYKNDSESERRQIISVDDAATLMSSILETRDKAIILLFLKTGMRLGELASLDVSNISLDDLSLSLKETAKRSNRLLYFDHETAKVLEHWLAIRALRKGNEHPALFPSNRGARLCTAQIHGVVTKHAELIGLHDPESAKLDDKFGPHCCRHWFTTHLLRAGMRREYVKWLREDSIHEAVDIYYHIDPEDVRKEYMMHISQLGV